MIVREYDIKTQTWTEKELPDETIPEDTPEPAEPTPEERIAALEEQLAAAKILLGVE